jgi:hypothetical protein
LEFDESTRADAKNIIPSISFYLLTTLGSAPIDSLTVAGFSINSYMDLSITSGAAIGFSFIIDIDDTIEYPSITTLHNL